MKTHILVLLMFLTSANLQAQTEVNAGTWKPWLIESVGKYKLSPPAATKSEVASVIAAQKSISREEIDYWNAGAPGYRWYDLVTALWMTDASGNGALAQALVSTAIYDATIAAWGNKYTFKRQRPFAIDNKVVLLVDDPQSPSYPCEYSVTAGAASTIIAHFYPQLADSVNRMAQRMMSSRVSAGVAFPSDTRAGFELGKKIAEAQIEKTKGFISTKQFDGRMPDAPGKWTGKFAMLPMAGLNKTIALDSASQFRPAAPPDYTNEMAELKNFKQTFSSRANAFHYASQNTNGDLITLKIFEHNLQHNAPRAARIYAAIGVAFYDAFTACWDAKYTYWGIRPNQYDSTYKPLMQSPPFPGFPSGHATLTASVAELLSYFFPAEKPLFQKLATEAAESRFHAGIHFRSDNDAGLVLGKRVAEKVIERLMRDGGESGNETVKR